MLCKNFLTVGSTIVSPSIGQGNGFEEIFFKRILCPILHLKKHFVIFKLQQIDGIIQVGSIYRDSHRVCIM